MFTHPVGFFGGELPNELLFHDWRNPTQQGFPALANNLFSSRSEAAIFLCDEAAGNLVDKIASLNLVASGSPLQNRHCMGFFDGVDLNNKRGVEFSPDSVLKSFQAASGTPLDVDASTSIMFAVWWRTTDAILGDRALVDKMNGSAGYNFFTGGAGDNLNVQIWDGVTVQSAGLVGGHNDQAWHLGVGMIDRTAGIMRVFSNSSGSPGASVAITAGDLSNTKGFQVGNNALAGGPTAAVRAGQTMIAAVYVYTGSDAEGFAQSELDAAYIHGNQNTTNKIALYMHAGTIASQADEESGFGTRICHWGKDEFCTLFRIQHTHATKLGAQFQFNHTNFAKHSIEFDNVIWVKTDMSVAKHTGEAPDGAETATTLTATDVNATMTQDVSSPAFTTEHTAIIFARRVGGTDVSFNLRIRRIDTGVALGTLNATATNEWKPFAVEGQPVTSTSRWELEIPGNGDAIEIWEGSFWKDKLNEALLNFPVRTRTATATGLRTEAPFDNPNDKFLRMLRGEIEIVACYGETQPTPSLAHGLLETAPGAGEISMLLNGIPSLFVLMRNSAGVTVQVITSTGSHDTAPERKYRFRWESFLGEIDPPGIGPENGDIFVDAIRKTGANATWTPQVPAKDKFFIGSNDGLSAHYKGSMSIMRIYSKPQAV